MKLNVGSCNKSSLVNASLELSLNMFFINFFKKITFN